MKRINVKPDCLATVKFGHSLDLDPHLCLSKPTIKVKDGGQFIIISLPRKKDGINLVRIRINSTDEYECYY
jgi:hypothetical protein